MLQMLGIAGLFLLATALGNRLLGMLRAGILPDSLRLAYALGLGLVALSLGTFALALIDQARLFPVLLMLAGLAMFARSEGKLLLEKVWRLEWSFPGLRDWFFWLSLGLTLVLIELAFISSAAHILSADFDSFHQYLTFPMEYFKNGGLTVFEWHPSFGFPQLGEILSLLGIILFGVVGPFYLNFTLIMVLVAIVFQVLRHFGIPPFARNVYTLCILTSPTVYALGSGIVKIEPLYFLYFVLIFSLAREILLGEPARSLSDHRTKVFLGLFLGALLSIKYTAFLIVAAFWISLWIGSEKKWLLFRQAVIVMTMAFLVFSPWLIKNWMIYKSPFYPIFSGQDQFFLETGKSLIPGFRAGAEHDMILQFSSVIHASGNILIDNLQIFLVSIFTLSPVGLFPGVWTVLLLALLPFTLARFRALDRYGKFLVWFALLFALAWTVFLLGAMWYLYPIWFALLFLVATHPLTGGAARWVTGCFAVLAVMSGLVLLASTVKNVSLSISFANGDTTLHQAMRDKWGSTASLDAYDRLNALLAKEPDGKVYSFQDPRGYFIDHSSDRFILDYYGEKLLTMGSPDEIRGVLRSIGVRYILGTRSREADCNRSKTVENPICTALDRFLRFVESESLPILFTDGGVTIYKL